MTTHFNPDTSWQIFGHLTLQQQHKDVLEVRAKVVGGKEKDYLTIQNFVINHKAIGAIQVVGGCVSQEQCDINIQSQRIALQPLLKLLQSPDTADGSIEDIKINSQLHNGRWVNYAQATWQDFSYVKKQAADSATRIHIPASTLHVSDFDWRNKQAWNIHQVVLQSPLKSEIEINKITFHQHQLSLPITFNHTSYWLPAAQWLWSHEHITGQGQVNGTLQLELQHHELTSAHIALDASDAEISHASFKKPQNIPLNITSKLLWNKEKSLTIAELALTLNASTIQLRQDKKHWYFTDINIDLDQLKAEGIQPPDLWKPWHGYIRGHTTLYNPHEKFIIEEANIDLIQFGKGRHFVDGQIIVNGTLWDVENLHWIHEKNEAEFFGGQNNQFDIVAQSLDAQALVLLQSLPFSPHGKLTSKALRLPFGTLRDVSASYKILDNSLSLQDFTSKFYEGTLHAKQVNVFTQGENVAMRSTIQVGGIHLNNWLWLHKQFDTHLQATVYATLNLYAEFDEKQRLSSWKGDGDVSIYNGIWLFHKKNIKADKLSLKLRKRKEFNSTFTVEDDDDQGFGTLRIDAEKDVSGQFKWLDKTYIFSKTWPKFRFQEETLNTQETPQ
ncbi:MAG: hypothetical protein Q9N67_05695 [Ghiorsea sp.]|nr:hypothetical protein [Ghiorsea sp.]